MPEKRCSYCDHTKDSHKEEAGFYDVKPTTGPCDVVGCPCEKYR